MHRWRLPILTLLLGIGVVSCWRLPFLALPFNTPVVAATTFTPFKITGVVRDYDGTALRHVSVSTAFDDPANSFAFTDVNGAYTLTLPAGVYHIGAHKFLNLLDPPEQTVTVTADQTNLNFTFPPRYTIRGLVRQADGANVAGALVATDFDDPIRAFSLTNGGGAYTLTVLAGTYTLVVSKANHIAPPAKTATVPPSITNLDFTFIRPALVSGTVRNEAGNPIAGADVYGGVTTAQTDANGAYTAYSALGEPTFQARKVGYQASTVLLVPTPPDSTGVDFVLRRLDRTIRGRVMNLQSQPLAGVNINATNLLGLRFGDAAAPTDANGNFTLTVPAGVFWLVAEHKGYVDAPPIEANLTTEVSAQVDFMLEATRYTLQGAVSDNAGAPLSGATVTALDCDLFYFTATDAVGLYSLPVGTGDYRVRASKAGYEDTTSQRVLLPPDAPTVNFTLTLLPGPTPIPTPPPAPTYTISGQVTDTAGQPLASVNLRAQGSGIAVTSNTSTNAQGLYTLTVRTGSYAVTADKPYYTPSPTQTVTTPPSQAGIDFVMAPVARDRYIRGRVTDRAGRPINDLAIEADLQSGLGERERKQVYYNGTYTITLAAGTYAVAPDDFYYIVPAPTQLSLPPDQDALNFMVRPIDQLITGRVVDDNGNPICGAQIRASGDIAGSDSSERNGRYALRLPAGNYSVAVSKSGYVDLPLRAVNLPPHALNTDFALTVATPTATPQPSSGAYLPLIQR